MARPKERRKDKLINQSLHVVDLNIDRYDMIIGRDLIRSLGIDIHGVDMTIHWDDAAIPWRDIDSTAKDVWNLCRAKGWRHRPCECSCQPHGCQCQGI